LLQLLFVDGMYQQLSSMYSNALASFLQNLEIEKATASFALRQRQLLSLSLMLMLLMMVMLLMLVMLTVMLNCDAQSVRWH